jgi:hypothetical protein
MRLRSWLSDRPFRLSQRAKVSSATNIAITQAPWGRKSIGLVHDAGVDRQIRRKALFDHHEDAAIFRERLRPSSRNSSHPRIKPTGGLIFNARK